MKVYLGKRIDSFKGLQSLHFHLYPNGIDTILPIQGHLDETGPIGPVLLASIYNTYYATALGPR